MLFTALKPKWNLGGRLLVFLLAATSLGCLLADFYGLCSMRTFAVRVFLPAMFLLAAIAAYDFSQGDGQLGTATFIGSSAGLLAAVSYDLFRTPFVFARAWGLASVLPSMNLFKVFPAFGAMLLAQPVQQTTYSTGASLLGWGYHFSNGATIGVMYMALIGNGTRRHWSWAILLAVGLELGMLLTPYPRVFGIPVTIRFVLVTLAAHAIFGVVLGFMVVALARRAKRRAAALSEPWHRHHREHSHH